MYTGIVQAACEVLRVEDQAGLRTLTLRLDGPLSEDLALGASVAVDGVCLTVTAQRGERVRFDVMQQTLDHTTLGRLQAGQRVNVERSARYGDEIGGHALSGHIDAAVEIVDLEQSANNRALTFQAPAALMPYIFPQGYIGLNGCSLTVASLDRAAGTFTVRLIPETLRVTTYAGKQRGDRVNLEVDRQTQAIVDTVRAYLEEHAGQLA